MMLVCLGVFALGAAAARAEGGPDLAGMDTSVRPGNDFFAYANGTWVRTTQIPADRSNYGTFSILGEKVDKQVAGLLEGASGQVGDYYAAFMDEGTIEAKGAQPLAAGLSRIARVSDRKALAAEFGSELRADVDALNSTNFHTPNLFGLWIAADLEHPTRYLPYLLQGGLSLPDREYYLSSAPDMTQIRVRFEEHIARTLSLAGIGDAQDKARRIFALERTIAQTHWTRADSEDVAKANDHWPRERFARDAPGLDWDSYFAAAHLQQAQVFAVWQSSALIAEAALVASAPLEDWKAYLQFHYIDDNAPLLSKAFVDEGFAFYGKVLDATLEQSPRWKRAVEQTDDALGDAVGKLYVAQYFSPQDKAAVEALVGNLIAAFHRRIDGLTWMSPQTKLKAHAKLAALVASPPRYCAWLG